MVPTLRTLIKRKARTLTSPSRDELEYLLNPVTVSTSNKTNTHSGSYEGGSDDLLNTSKYRVRYQPITELIIAREFNDIRIGVFEEEVEAGASPFLPSPIYTKR